MAAPFSSKGGYRPAPLASLPPELNPAEYDASPEKRRADAERLAIRSKLKREFLVQLNNPLRAERIDNRDKLIEEGKYERPFRLA
uniref:NADH dehydrogenase [ubiquinone] 1 beta subcomplex subunit 4 n=1 Tax=Salvator merianae TaxID=96440 RepID=A0A8D0BC20_SALMN